MPRQPIAMHEIKEILRLHYAAGHTQREISRATGVSQPAIQRLLKRAGQAGLGWPLGEPAPSDGELYALLYPKAALQRHRQPDFAQVQEQLRSHKRLTLEQLWVEYCEPSEAGQAYSYSQFCALYKHWRQSQEVVLAHDHVAGEMLFVDYAGDTATVYEASGSWEAQIFVAALGASVYTYAEASRGQAGQLPRDPRAHPPLPARGAARIGPGEPSVGRGPSGPLRTARQSQLPGTGRTLRRCGRAGARAQVLQSRSPQFRYQVYSEPIAI